MSYYVGIDIGGTFTDAVLLDDEGVARLLKTPTTLDEPARGVNDALALAEQELGLPEGSLLGQVDYFGLGTTVATNALIERTGVRTGIITTRGFRDTLLVQRGTGLHEIMHFSRRRQPAPIVPRELIEEVVERVDYKGSVIAPLDEADVRRAVQALLDQDVQAIAVCLLWSFREPAHERRVAEIVREMAPGVYLSTSSELAPVLGEYERTATTALNAYLGPHVERYMTNLGESLRERGMTGTLRILDSGGGVITPERCGQAAVSILTSGPTGGVLASAKLAERLGTPNVLTTDMGGTSFDVGMIVDHEPVVAASQEVNGYRVLQPAVQVVAIGAGGSWSGPRVRARSRGRSATSVGAPGPPSPTPTSSSASSTPATSSAAPSPWTRRPRPGPFASRSRTRSGSRSRTPRRASSASRTTGWPTCSTPSPSARATTRATSSSSRTAAPGAPTATASARTSASSP